MVFNIILKFFFSYFFTVRCVYTNYREEISPPIHRVRYEFGTFKAWVQEGEKEKSNYRFLDLGDMLPCFVGGLLHKNIIYSLGENLIFCFLILIIFSFQKLKLY